MQLIYLWDINKRKNLKRNTILLTSIILLIGLASVHLSSQAGLDLYGGISSATNRNITITPEGSSHSGWHVGADARLNRGKMYFLVGLQYHKIDLLPKSDNILTSETYKYAWTKVRVGLGYKVIDFSDHIFLRGHTLASFNLTSGVTNDAGPGIYTDYNAGTAGANLGLGLDIYNFTVTAAYEIGFFNLGNMLEGSEMDFLTLSIGYKI